MTTTNNTHPTTTPEPVDSTHPSFDEKAEDEAIKQIEDDRIVVNLESIEVVPNLDEVCVYIYYCCILLFSALEFYVCSDVII